MADFVDTAPRSGQRKQLLLLGAEHAHLCVLARIAKRPLAGVQVTLVTPNQRQFHPHLLAGLVAGHYAPDQCVTALAPLLHNSGVRWLASNAIGVDANARTVRLDDGARMPYDWLSIDTGLVQERERIEQALPGAREHGLFARPGEAFAALWPRVTALGPQRLRSVAVIGDDAAGIELAMAIRHVLPQVALTLITGGDPVGAAYPRGTGARVAMALRKRAITVLADQAREVRAGEIVLGCGARLACDVPIVATGARPPAWIAASGLALDDAGFISVDALGRSTSHVQVFAAHTLGRPGGRASGDNAGYAPRAGRRLADNLLATTQGGTAKPQNPPTRRLSLLSCGDRMAIASWGNLSAQGRWVWFWKKWIDRGFMRSGSG